MPDENLCILQRLQAYADKVNDPARLAQFRTFGAEHYADAEFLNLLREALVDIYQNGGGGNGGGGTIDQDNIFVTKTLGIQAGYTAELLAIAINNAPQFTVTEKQLLLIFVNVAGTPSSQFDVWVLVNLGKGNYGFNSGNTLTAADIKKVAGPQDISMKLTGTQATDAETQTTTLPISGGKFIDTVRFFNWQESSRFRSLVRAISLAGLSVATGGDITSSDSIISAFGKLQNQITSLLNLAIQAGTDSTIAIKKLSTVEAYPVSPIADTLYFVPTTEFEGPVSVTATASTTVNIPHGQSFTPSFYGAWATNALATGSFAISADSTNIILTYSTARTAGTANYMVRWKK